MEEKILHYSKDIADNKNLAVFAQKDFDERATRRKNKNEKNPMDPRTPFQHDRDRIVHSKAFRRLMHKTQVFTATKGDHYRTRLTHTLEVMQIARQISRNLNINEDLAEAIALGHDLGHTPFGHIGERTLHQIIAGHTFEDIAYNGGFKHNYQSLHVVDNLENPYKEDHQGLDLCFAVREGIIKHTGNHIKVSKIDSTGKTERVKEKVEYLSLNLDGIDLEKPSFSLEGQAVAIADEIAQRTHDLDDGFRARYIDLSDIENEAFVKRAMDNLTSTEKGNLNEHHYPLIRSMMRILTDDALKQTVENLQKVLREKPECKFFEERIISFSKDIDKEQNSLQETINEVVINSLEVCCMDCKAEKLINDLFYAYYSGPQQLPDDYLKKYFYPKQGGFKRKDINKYISIMQGDPEFIRLICDYISLMTDQYAFKEYNKLFLPEA